MREPRAQHNRRIDTFARRSGVGHERHRLAGGDVSARPYRRINHPGIPRSLTDANSARGEHTASFARLARCLPHRCLGAPNIPAEDKIHGLPLIKDCGSAFHALLLYDRPETGDGFHCAAFGLYWGIIPIPDFPAYDAKATAATAALPFSHHPAFLTGRDGQVESDWFQPLPPNLPRGFPAGQTVPCFRDCHAEVFFRPSEREGPAQFGLINFRDMFPAHPACDPVSSPQGTRHNTVGNARVTALVRFPKAYRYDPDKFPAARALSGVRRDPQIISVFGTSAKGKGRSENLRYVPGVRGRVLRESEHPAVAAVAKMPLGSLSAPRATALKTLASQ